jgi:hypothetical protein
MHAPPKQPCWHAPQLFASSFKSTQELPQQAGVVAPDWQSSTALHPTHAPPALQTPPPSAVMHGSPVAAVVVPQAAGLPPHVAVSHGFVVVQ